MRPLRVRFAPNSSLEGDGFEPPVPPCEMDFREEAQRQLARSRSFGNRRQLAAYAGLAPRPWRSGTVDQERGISKAGNPRLRRTM